MRRPALCALLGLFALGACQREKSFDERYAETRRALETKAAAIDRELDAAASDAAAADVAADVAADAGTVPQPTEAAP